MVDWCAEIRSKTCSSTCGQIDACRGGPAADPDVSISVLASSAMSSTGTTTLRSHCLVNFGCTTDTGRSPPRKRATSSTGRTVADRPIRWAGLGSRASSRSSVSARCAPRLVPATACTSSTMTVSTPRNDSRPWDVSSRNSDSGVVISTSDGLVANLRRSLAGVSPDRTATSTSIGASPSRRAVSRMPISGARRLRSTSTASAFSGDT
jgi:hypothetical protein